MYKINNNKFYHGEEVYINNGRLMNIKGQIVGLKEDEKKALIKIGTVTHEVEFEFIEKVETDRVKLFLVTKPHDFCIEFICIIAGKSEEEVRNRINRPGIDVIEIDEIQGYDVILQ